MSPFHQYDEIKISSCGLVKKRKRIILRRMCRQFCTLRSTTVGVGRSSFRTAIYRRDKFQIRLERSRFEYRTNFCKFERFTDIRGERMISFSHSTRDSRTIRSPSLEYWSPEDVLVNGTLGNQLNNHLYYSLVKNIYRYISSRAL